MADNHEDKRIVSFETEFDRELATNSNNKKQQVMKTKLSVLLLYLCSLTLFAACSNNRQKQKTPAENVATPIRNFLKQKYPAATILKSEKETNGTEVDIQRSMVRHEGAMGLHTLGNQRPRRSCRHYGCVAKLRLQPI